MFHGHASADGMVIIEISPEKTKHHFHKALLVYHLEYFARALVGPCLEAEERRVALDDVDTDAFNLFINWLYTQRIPHDDLEFRSVVKGPTAGNTDSMNQGLILLKAYALGDRVLAPSFRREAHNSYVQRSKSYGTAPSSILPRVACAFANIPRDRVILQFLVNDFCRYFTSATVRKCEASALMVFPPAFNARVIRRYGYGGLKQEHKSCYLEHASEEAKQACKKTHMNFAGEGTNYGFFGEPQPI